MLSNLNLKAKQNHPNLSLPKMHQLYYVKEYNLKNKKKYQAN